MKRTGKKLSQLKKSVKLYPQVREDIKVTRKDPLDQIKEVSDEIKSVEKALGDKGRIFVRYSGTEPLCRVMVEGEEHSQISAMAKKVASLIRKNVG